MSNKYKPAPVDSISTQSALTDINRRSLLQLGASASAGLLLGACRIEERISAPATWRGGLVIGPGLAENEFGDKRSHLSLVNLDLPQPTIQVTPTEFFGHGVVIDPTDPGRAVLFEKRGTGACELDLRSHSVTRPITSPKGREFYGHGAFSADAGLLYATETQVDDYHRGVVVVRDGKSLKELGEFPTYGAAPHDCILRDEGRTLVFTNGGSPEPGGSAPCVTFVDSETEKLIEKIEFDTEALNAGHLAMTERGALAVVSAMRDYMPREALGGASLRPVGGEFRTLREPVETTRRMIGETLSVAIHEPTGVVGATNPMGNLVTFWQLDSGKFLGELNLSAPRGIAKTLDGTQFIISYGKSTSLLRVDPGTLDPIPDSRVPESQIGGSHIVVHSLG